MRREDLAVGGQPADSPCACAKTVRKADAAASALMQQTTEGTVVKQVPLVLLPASHAAQEVEPMAVFARCNTMLQRFRPAAAVTWLSHTC